MSHRHPRAVLGLLLLGRAWAYENTSCLLYQGDGCAAITDEILCVNSRDGVSYEDLDGLVGQPCAWDSNGLCKRADLAFLQSNSDYKLAACKEDRTVADTIATVTPPARDQTAMARTSRAHMPWNKVDLEPMDGGVNRACRGVVKTQTGQRLFDIWTAESLDQCKNLCTGKCKGIEYKASTMYCEVWYGYVLFSTNASGYDCYAVPNKDVDAELSLVRTKDETCLKSAADGCSALTDRYACLSSKDGGAKSEIAGLKIAGEPCVWCGGSVCHSGSTAMCEPFDYLLRGEQKEHGFGTFNAKSLMETPECKDGMAMVYEKANADWKPSPPTQAQLAALSPATTGCYAIQDMGTCLSSRDASGVPTWSDTPYKVNGEACVWCGGLTCTERSAALCMPFDLLMNGQGPHHTTFIAKHTFTVAEIKGSAVILEGGVDTSCLSSENEGCPTLLDEYSCLASKDGRAQPMIKGRKVSGQPCVWCDGVTCNSGGSNKCEAFDMQMNGEGSAFKTSYSTKPQTAQCVDGLPKAHHNMSAPALPPAADMANLACLTSAASGCFDIKDKLGCLSSVDGGSTQTFAGLALHGSPCVWCGGTACTSGGDSLCAPYDYLAKGTGKAFSHITAVSMTTSKCSTAPVEDFGAETCLTPAMSGCKSLKDWDSCTKSKDGRSSAYIAGLKVKDQPCVWCAGGLCHSGSTDVCEAYDFALNGEGHAFNTKYANGVYTRASCNSDGKPWPLALPSYVQLHGLSLSVDCGHPNPIWEKVGQSCGFCKALVPSISEKYSTCAEYCTAQGGLECASASKGTLGSCEGSAAACETSFATGEHAVCECKPSEDLGAEAPSMVSLMVPEEKMTCLNPVAKGCASVTDKLSCLSSKDASGNITFKTTKIDGQPCVWCGGGACTTSDSSVCAAYDFLANGQGVAYASRNIAPGSMEVASCSEATMNFQNLACLKTKPEGCIDIKDKETCLSSSDGRPYQQVAGLKVQGQPCVWCGGVSCNTNNENMCEPYDFAIHGEGHAYENNQAKHLYTVAACEAGKPVDHPVNTYLASFGVTTTVDCGVPHPVWYKVGRSCGFCKVQIASKAISVYGNCRGYCDAQGNKTCVAAWSGSPNSCDTMSAMSCDTQFSSELNPICECSAPPKVYADIVARPAEAQMTCLESQAAGCFAIKDRLNCLSSRDGSGKVGEDNLKIDGEPCVWCADGLCTSDSEAVCAPYDWMMYGAGIAFHTVHAEKSAVQVAECKANADADFNNLQCLTVNASGCNSIKDEDACLKSVDGRPYEYVAGLKAKGQPCVWCGGGPCHSGNNNLCEPYDYAVNGEGHAFNTFHAVGTYKQAACEDGHPAVHLLSSGLTLHGTALQVECGNSEMAWHKVSRTCGTCKVVVPKIKEYYNTCQDYCRHQTGSPKCVSASVAQQNSCDVAAIQTCDHTFEEADDALCECSTPPKVLLPHEKVQIMYAQCGGKGWLGYTLCEAGAICNVVNEYYSQCVPVGAATPGLNVSGQDDLGATLGAAPLDASMSVGASCAASDGCAALGLLGNCCPNDDGVSLDCCGKAAMPATSASVTSVTAVSLGSAAPKSSAQPSWYQPAPTKVSCLTTEHSAKGCGSIRDKLICLSSMDGREGYTAHGLQVGGQACVWCGGGPCTSNNDALCEPHDWLMNGQGSAYTTFLAAGHFTVATCETHHSNNAVFAPNSLTCLEQSTIGCNHIKDMNECLGSTDARPYEYVAGFRVKGQPCVWCAGTTCTSNNGNMCEPYDFVMNGAGHAFSTFHAIGNYYVAGCEDGKPAVHLYPDAVSDRGMPMQVKCGTSKPTWVGVSQTCGTCKVMVPNLQATYKTCSAYCAAQHASGVVGLNCVSAAVSYSHSCEIQTSTTCDAPLQAGESALCQCDSTSQASSAAIAAAKSVPNAAYWQCGGDGFAGQTQCEVNASCKVIYPDFSMCLPKEGDAVGSTRAGTAMAHAYKAMDKTPAEQAAAAGKAASIAFANGSPRDQGVAAFDSGFVAGKGALMDDHEAIEAAEAAAIAAGTAAGMSKTEATDMAEAAAAFMHDTQVPAHIHLDTAEESAASAAAMAGEAAGNMAKDAGKTIDVQASDAAAAAAQAGKAAGANVSTQVAYAGAAAYAAVVNAGGKIPAAIDAAAKGAKDTGVAAGMTVVDATAAAKTAAEAAAAKASLTGDAADSAVAHAMAALNDPVNDAIPESVLVAGRQAAATAKTNGETAAHQAGAAAQATAEASKAAAISAANAGVACEQVSKEIGEGAGLTPTEVTAGSDAAKMSAETWMTQNHGNEDVSNVGADCWEPCAHQSGYCAFCGAGNACCRQNGDTNPPPECTGISTYTTWHNECVEPAAKALEKKGVHNKVVAAINDAIVADAVKVAVDKAVADGKAVEEQASVATAAAVSASKTIGYTLEEQAVTGGVYAAATTAIAGYALDSQVVVGGTAAAGVYKDAAMDSGDQISVAAETAMKVAEKNGADAAGQARAAGLASAAVAKSNAGMSPEEAYDAAKSQAKEVLVNSGLSDDQVTVTMTSIAAIAPAHFGAVPVAPATAAPVATPEPAATLAPVTVAPVTTPEPAATLAPVTVAPVTTPAPAAASVTPASSSANSSGKEAVKNAFADCMPSCGKAGYCDDFCGKGNVCCRKSGDLTVPPECENIYSYFTPHYECVEPTYHPSSDSDDLIVANGASTDAAQDIQTDGDSSETPVTTAKVTDSFSTGQWIAVILAVLLICCAGCAGYFLSGQESFVKKQLTTREVDVALAEEAASAGDLELQAPLVRKDAVMQGGQQVMPIQTVSTPIPQYYSASTAQGMTSMAAGSVAAGSVAAGSVVYSSVPQVPAEPQVAAQLLQMPGAQAMVARFDAIDANHDNVLVRPEWNQAQGVTSMAAGVVPQQVFYQAPAATAPAPIQASGAQGPQDLFDRIDTDHDGFISPEEWNQALRR